MNRRMTRDTAAYTSMLGMPVLWYAVTTSPHGIVTAVRGPRPKSMVRVRQAAGTCSRRPSRRTRPPRCAFSMAVMAVPRESRPVPAMASVSRVAEGRRRFRCAARQSVATTSKPAPGSSMTPARAASSVRAASASNTAISPVTSR